MKMIDLTIDKWDGKEKPGHVIKYYNGASLDDKEIKGLQLAGQFVKEDRSDPNHMAVVMEEVPGKALGKIIAEEKDPKKRQDLIKEWRPKVVEAARKFAEDKGILHGYVYVTFKECSGVHSPF